MTRIRIEKGTGVRRILLMPCAAGRRHSVKR